ncbi:MAG: UDP-phosphate galactose phosphotransferase [Rhodospirillaceae bacterium]|nr:UDP-phosphate galactose phosphotransferase [Rhodospirillaceae bacterium]|tara:strand:+ start:1432 stop:2007 length:576 start_codon:yes stop_codon:yes gene_type:complete
MKCLTIKRLFDILLALTALSFFCLPMMVIACIVRLTSDGPAIYWSVRVGRYNRNFLMPKFRTMTIHAPTLATHLLQNGQEYTTSVGGVLRRTSLDELPQLWSILLGKMSFVGPRPALFNQYDLIELRTKAGVHTLLPGLTGWAQVNGRDELSITDKVNLDVKYMNGMSMALDLKILWKTVFRVIRSDEISH